MKVLKKFRGFILAFAICFLLPLFIFFVINQFIFDDENSTFTQEYNLCGVEVGNLTKKEAENKLNSFFQTGKNNINLEINYNDKSWNFNEDDFEVKSNIHTIIEQAYKTNHKGNYLTKLKNIKKIKKMGFSSEVALSYSLIGIQEKIDNICKEVEIPFTNSEVNFDTKTNKFNITESKPGISIDKERLYEELEKTFQKGANIKISLPIYTTQPQVTQDNLTKATKKQSQFTTNYQKSSSERKNNIKLATAALNGTKIEPNEEFSFNQTIGRRTSERGYKQANIIKDGNFVKGIGGGVCQVSSTLFNALLLANIDVCEYHKHTLPVSYVKPGLDAMVSWGSADLKFVNTTHLPIFILASCDGNEVKFEIYGDTKDESMQIKTSSEIVKKISSSGDKIIPDTDGKYADKIMFKGEYFRVKYPKDGYEAKSYVEYYKDGVLIDKKQIRHATYEAQNGLIYEGTDTLPNGMTLPKDKYTKLN